ncbi:hypothetical protein [Mesorhizobium sp. M0062]
MAALHEDHLSLVRCALGKVIG